MGGPDQPLVKFDSSWRDRVRGLLHRSFRPVRYRYYARARGTGAAAMLPVRWQRRLGLDDPTAVGSRRIEIGSGGRPQDGYIHVDLDPRAWHVEVVAPAWRLPFPDDWADEIVAVHTLEHVHPRLLLPTLREWWRVLAPGGRVCVHVPNTAQLVVRFAESPVEQKWALMAAVLGMNAGPDTSRPEELNWESQHQVLFDEPLLRWTLESAGYRDLKDLTCDVEDVHTRAWKHLVRNFSLIVEARKDGLG